MSPEENALWKKITTFEFDDEHSRFRFSDRLAIENGWTKNYADQVIEEYKKFIFLCCVSRTGITPSDQVDQVWHLHLTYTKSYWITLCKNTIEKEIHHNPTRGGNAEHEKFNDFYSETLALYKDKFSHEAPQNIWPDNERRFSDINFQRVNLRKFWLIRKPKLKKAHLLFLLLLVIPFYVNAEDANEKVVDVMFMIIVIAIIVYAIFFTKKDGRSGRRSEGSGCGGSGCGGSADSGYDDDGHHSHSDSGHSGCSGCSSSGCSGCGSD